MISLFGLSFLLFISFIIWIVDIGQVSANVTLIISLIFNFNFLMYFYPFFL